MKKILNVFLAASLALSLPVSVLAAEEEVVVENNVENAVFNIEVKNPLIECFDVEGNVITSAKEGQEVEFRLKQGCGKTVSKWNVSGLSVSYKMIYLGSDFLGNFAGDFLKGYVESDIVVDAVLEDGYGFIIDPNGGQLIYGKGSAQGIYSEPMRLGVIFSQNLPDQSWASSNLIAPVGKTFDGWIIDGKKYDAGYALNAKNNVTALVSWRDLNTNEYFVSDQPSVKLKDLEDKKSVVFNVDGNQVMYDERALDAIKYECESDSSEITVELKAVTKENAGLNNEQLKVLENENVDGLYTICLTVDGNQIDYFDGGQSVVRVNYNKKYEHSKFRVYRVEEWGNLTEVESYYQDGQVNWVTGSHSCYMIQEVEDTDFVDETDKKPEADKKPEGDKKPETEQKPDSDKKTDANKKAEADKKQEANKKAEKADTNTSVATSLKAFGSMMVVSLLGLFVFAKKRS